MTFIPEYPLIVCSLYLTLKLLLTPAALDRLIFIKKRASGFVTRINAR
jgi:hypothetical protein